MAKKKPELKLTQEEILKMALAEEQALAANARIQLAVLLKDQYLKQIDPNDKLAAFLNDIKANTDKFVAAKSSATELKTAIEARLGIQLKNYCYSTETGELTEVP